MILSAIDIHKRYIVDGNDVSVLKGVNLEVKEGEILAIKGPSGAGKSTLLHILGLLDCPTSGEVIIEGRKFIKGRVNSKLRARYIGFVFQFYNLLADFNVLENVCLPSLVVNRKLLIGKDLRKHAEEILGFVGLSDRLKHRPCELSGGEQQRVAIARAIINKPKLLLADEPTGNLDTQNAEKIWSLLIKLREEQKQTIVIVTHNEALAKKADRMLQIVDGRIAVKVQ